MIGITPKPKRKRQHYSCKTYPSAVLHPVRSKTYIDTAAHTEPEHLCISDCHCKIRTTPKPAETFAIARTAVEPRYCRLLTHIAHTLPILLRNLAS